MKWLKLAVVFGVVVCTLWLATHWLPYPIQNRIDSVLRPGYQTADLDHLDRRFRKRVDKILIALRKQGFSPLVSSTFRSPAYQDFLYNISQLVKPLGLSGFTSKKGGGSHHNRMRKGKPASRAVDLRAHMITPLTSLQLDPYMDEHVRFFKALGKLAKKHRLKWGGNPKVYTRHSVWKQYGLGWDPGHINM